MLRFRLLGPLAVERDGRPVDLGTPKQRAVLAVLAQQPGGTVSTDRIVDAVWAERPPANVQASLHANISRLRAALRADASAPPPIVRRTGGYLLDVAPADVDVTEFTAAASAAGAAVERREWDAAVGHAQRALALWRGEYLADLRDEEWVRVAAAPLEERRAGADEALVVGLLGVGDLPAALAGAIAARARRPLAERSVWLHMLALHRAGRSTEALEVYRDFARRLDDELGLQVGSALRDLHGALLRQDPELLTWPGPPAPAAAAPAPRPGTGDAPAGGPARDTPDLDPSPAVDLVGRQSELAAVEAALERAAGGAPSWVVLSASAGMGKTRLAHEAGRRWAAGGGEVVRGQCPDLDDVPAWWPVRQLLRGLGADPDAVLAPPVGGDADAARFAVVEAAVTVVRDRIAAGPLLLVVEDVHWADAATATFLSVLAETVTSGPLAVVLTRRPSRGRPVVERLLATVARRPDATHLDLPALTVAEIADLVARVDGTAPDTDQVDVLAARTGGTPFFVLEYARLPPGERAGAMVPAAVRAVVQRRFATLPPPVLDTLGVAAVLGEPLDVPLLAAVTGRAGDEVADLLDAAADADLLVASVDGTSYAFGHALLQDELAAGVPDLRRRRLHLQAVHALPDKTVLPTLLRRARHLQAAGTLADADLAHRVFRQAAEAADGQWLADTAATWWHAAAQAHARRADPDPDEFDTLVGARVRALAWAGRGQAVLDALDAALLDALRAGRTASAGRLAANLVRVSGSWPWPVYGSDPAPLLATLAAMEGLLHDDPGARARVLAVTAIGRCYDPDPRVPDDLSRRAMELAAGTGDDGVLADAILGRALTYAGVATRAEESLALLERLAGLAYGAAAADQVLSANLATMALFTLGRLDECADQVHRAALQADVLRLPVNRVQLRWAEASVAQWRGQLGRADELYRRAELAHRRTDLQQSGTFELTRLVQCWDRGELERADGDIPSNPMVARWTSVAVAAAAGRPGCDAALAAEIAHPEPQVWTSHGRWALLGHAVADRGLVELAPVVLAALTPVRDCVAAFGQCGAVGPVALAMARLARLVGDRATARDHLTRAAAIARDTGGASALLQGRLYAAVWAKEDDGDSPDLRHELAAVAAQADAQGMPGIARRARAG